MQSSMYEKHLCKGFLPVGIQQVNQYDKPPQMNISTKGCEEDRAGTIFIL